MALLNKPVTALSRFPRVKDTAHRAMTKLHTTLYRRTGGRVGRTFGVPALLLTVRGRKSGKDYTTPLYYVRDGGRFVVAGSYGGDPRPPQWFSNLIAAQTAQVQVGSEILNVTPRVVEGVERERLWCKLSDAWPSFPDYQKHTERRIPVVVLEPHQA